MLTWAIAQPAIPDATTTVGNKVRKRFMCYQRLGQVFLRTKSNAGSAEAGLHFGPDFFLDGIGGLGAVDDDDALG